MPRLSIADTGRAIDHMYAVLFRTPGSDRLHQPAALAQQGSDCPPRGNGLRGVAAMPQRVAVADRRAAAGGAAMHPTAALSPYRR